MTGLPINPWDWSLRLGYSQGLVVQGAVRQLTCAGQTAVDETGAPQHPGDMRAQMALALDNLQAVLQAAGMGWADLTRLTILTTDVDAALASLDLLGARLGPAGAAPPMTVAGVTRLALAPLMVEIEATAASAA